MIRTPTLASIGMVLAGAVLLPAAAQQAQNSASAAATAHRTTLQLYCIGCHSGPTPFAGLNLEPLDFANLEDNGAIWEKLLRKLRGRQMPPAGMPRPDEATYEALVKYIETGRDRLAEVKPNPGRPTLHRLNRTEYANAIRDLLALEIDVAELLPADDIGYGFDNIGDVLPVSPLLLERYLSAAGKISRLAVGDTTMPVSYQTYTVPHGLIQLDRMSEAVPVGSRGGTAIRHRFPVDGEYEISVGLQRGRNDEFLGLGRERKLDLRLDDQRLELFTIAADPRAGELVYGAGTAPDAHLKVRLPVKAGTRELAATFLKDTLIQEGIIDKVRDDDVRTYFEGVGSITVAGPYNVQGPGATPSRDKIFICHPAARAEEQACAEKDPLQPRPPRLSAAGYCRRYAATARALPARRPERRLRVGREIGVAEDSGVARVHFPCGVRSAGRGSRERPPDQRRRACVAPVLLPVEQHSRRRAARGCRERGRLSDPSVLEGQVRRMLADPRSQALVKNFAGQWLFLRNIARISPDPASFPNFDENLRQALAKETELLIESTLREDRSVADLLKTDYTFLNQRLAEHYGIKGIYGSEFRRVALDDPKRHGLLGQASILTVTSYPNRTAPTIRGKWVLEQLLGTPPPPPPPNVPSLKDDATTQKLTMRQRMEQHRSNPTCAACHKMMDPLGFALENFDGLGRWRDSTGPGRDRSIPPVFCPTAPCSTGRRACARS